MFKNFIENIAEKENKKNYIDRKRSTILLGASAIIAIVSSAIIVEKYIPDASHDSVWGIYFLVGSILCWIIFPFIKKKSLPLHQVVTGTFYIGIPIFVISLAAGLVASITDLTISSEKAKVMISGICSALTVLGWIVHGDRTRAKAS